MLNRIKLNDVDSGVILLEVYLSFRQKTKQTKTQRRAVTPMEDEMHKAAQFADMRQFRIALCVFFFSACGHS